MSMATRSSLAEIRQQFPSLQSGEIFMDNAGGSQVPASVADAVREYMLTSYVQTGAEYPASARATQTVADAHAMVNTIMGGDAVGRTIFGSSSSMLCRILAESYADSFQHGDEVVVAESGHEANVGPWVNLRRRGVEVKIWKADPETGVCQLSELQNLLTPRTKVVAFVHVSNILGQVEQVRPCIEAAHAVGARVVLDGVAYAPHLLVDVEAWNVDWYVFSCYKVFGPHIGAMFGKHEAFAELTGPNHYFLPKDYLPAKFELGGANHESCAGLLGLKPYLSYLAESNGFSRETVVQAWKRMEELEAPLTHQFLEFLASKPRVRVFGNPVPDRSRVPTISFRHESASPKQIASRALEAGIGMRHGNFYSVRLLERMGIDPSEGVARASFAHYNTPEEVDQLCQSLDEILN